MVEQLRDDKELKQIKGIVYRDGDRAVDTGWPEPIADLNCLPIPDYARSNTQDALDEPITVEGVIQGEENLILEGSMKGKVELEKHIFTVGPKGRFDGEVYARDVVVKGSLKGRINAINNLRISKDADFFGQAKIKTISIEGGALVKGVFEIARKPAAKAADSAQKAKPDKPAEVDPGKKSVKPTQPANPEANRQASQPSLHSLKGN